MDQIELAATKLDNNLAKIDLQELSLRILLILSLRFRWEITTTRAAEACSEDAVRDQLRSIGLEQNSIDNNIFSGDELVILLCHHELLIVGPEQQQEDLFLELSAYIALDQTNKLDIATQVTFANRTLSWNESSHSIDMSLPEAFCMNLVQQYLEDEEEKLCQNASGQESALDASRQKLYQQAVGELVLAAACRPDLCFEIHSLIQSFDAPTTTQEQQLQQVLRQLRATMHYSLSLHTSTKIKGEKVQSLELLAFSNASWTRDSEATSAAYMTLWGAPLVASCKTCSLAQNQGEAELQSVQLALGLACWTKMLLQQLGIDKLEHLVDIRLKTSSFHKELAKGKPIAMQLGISRKNKQIELAIDKGQLYLSKVAPQKNLAHSLTHTASDEEMLAKLRVLTGAADTGALSTKLSSEILAFVGSSSSLVGVIQEEPPAMEEQLRQLALSQSVFESFSKSSFARQRLTLQSLSLDNCSLESTSLQSLNLSSLSFQNSDSDSLTQHSFARQSLTEKSLSLDDANLQSSSFDSLTDISLRESNSASLTLRSCSLGTDNDSSLTLQSLSFENGSLKETEKEAAQSFDKGGAKTNSFPQDSLQEERCTFEIKEGSTEKEAGTNSFPYSFLDGILSLKMRLQTFLLISFQLTCAALFLVTSYVTVSFQSFSEQLCKRSLEIMVSQLDRISLSFSQFSQRIRQLDLSISLSLKQLGSTTSRSQLQNQFQTGQLVQQQLFTATAFADQHQQQQPQHRELDDNKLDANNIFDSNQLQRNQLEDKKQNKQLQEQQLAAIQLRQLHLSQLHQQDQPSTKQLSKKPCFTTSFSKQELERLHLTRSSFQQDLHQQQPAAQLLADHLAGTSFDINKPQQQQLVRQSFYPKMKEQNLAAFKTQLRPEHPTTAYSRLSLQQLTPEKLPSSALLLLILVVIILVDFVESFELPLQQLCLSKAQGGELTIAFPPACCTSCSLTACTLMSLSFTVAVLKTFSLDSRRTRSSSRRALTTSASSLPPLTRRGAWRQRSSSTTASTRTIFTTRALRQRTSSSIASKQSALSSRPPWRTRSFPTSTSSSTTLRASLSTSWSPKPAWQHTTFQPKSFRRTSLMTRALSKQSSTFATWSFPASRATSSRRTTSSRQTCRMTTLQTSAWRRTSFSTSSSTTSTSAFTTRTRSLMSTALLSILLFSFSFDKGIASRSFVSNELSANFSEELVEQEANLKAKWLQLFQLQQLQDRELGHQEQNRQLATSLALSQQLQREQFQLQILLWEQELEELLVNKSLPLGPFPWPSWQRTASTRSAFTKSFGDRESEEEACRHRVGQEELCKEELSDRQLWQDTRKSFQTTAFSRQLFSTQSDQPASQEQLATAECSQSSFTPRAFPSLLSKSFWEKNPFHKKSFKKPSLQTRPLTRTPLQQTACRPELQQDSFRQKSFRRRTFQSPASRHFALAAWKRPASRRRALTRRALTRRALTRRALTRRALTRRALTRRALTRAALTTRALTRAALTRRALTRAALTRRTLTKRALTRRALTRRAFTSKALRHSASPSTALKRRTSTSTASRRPA